LLAPEQVSCSPLGLRGSDSDDPVFKTWKNTVERTLIRAYGQPSPEVEQFRNLRFFYHAIIMTRGTDYSRQYRDCFDHDFQILTSSLRNYIEELQREPDLALPLSRANSEKLRGCSLATQPRKLHLSRN
jgi:hypothetical protein